MTFSLSEKYMKHYLIPVLIAFLIGLISDLIAGSGFRTFRAIFSFGFFVIIPTSVTLLITLLRIIKINKWYLTIPLSILFFLFSMIFAFWFYKFRPGGPVSDMYGLIYIFGFIPAVIIGILFGLFLSIYLKIR